MIVRSPEEVEARINEALSMVVNGVSQAVLESVKDKTPVETGTAQEGWDLTHVNDLRDDVLNDVSYIGILEYGDHNHEAHAMVRRTMMDAETIINENIPS